MKIALCLSGQPRYLDDGYNQIYNNLLSKYDIDVFVHTWWDETEIGKKFVLSEKLKYGRECKIEEDTLDKIIRYYKPKIFYNETQKKFNIYEDVNYGLLNPISPYSMYYSIMKSNQIKSMYELDKEFKYDLVIRCRFDIMFKTFNLDLNNLDSNLIYVSGEIDSNGQKNTPNDQFAISSSANMDYYSDLYSNLEKYKLLGFKNFIGEELLKHHIIDNSDKKIYFTKKNELLCDVIKNK